MLQKVKGLVELVVARGVFQLPENALKETNPPKEEEQPTSPEKVNEYYSSLLLLFLQP